ncbi:MAG: TonB-dependent receptor [Acidobacteriota bacterium]
MTRFHALSVLVLFAVFAAAAGGQSSSTTAALAGKVLNTAGEPVPGAAVSARDLATNQTRKAVTDAEGNYRLSALVVSTYDVEVESTGFADFDPEKVTLVLGNTTALDITLQPAGVKAEVEIKADADELVIDASRTASTISITRESIEELPVNSRNYLQFTLLAPGVAPSNTRSSNGGGNSGSPLADSGFTFGGLRPRSNSISIDGLTNIDETTGASLVTLSPEIVREFQIINNGISAEFGGAAGGTINVITKTGSNEFHGTVFTFFQNEHLNARTPDAGLPGKTLFRRYQPGISIGGPLIKDKLFFYAAGEQETAAADEVSEINGNVRSRINTALAAGFAPRIAVRELNAARFRTGADETEAAAKLTYLANSFNTINVRFAFTNDRRNRDAFNTDSLADPSARGSVYAKDFQTTGSLISVIHSSVINDVRGQYSSRHLVSRAGGRTGPAIDIVGVARFGRPFDADSDRRETRQEFVDTVSFTRGSHELKAGGSVNHVTLTSDLRDGFGGSYAFRSVDDFLTSRPAFWRQAFGISHTNFSVTNFGAFLQDRWQATPQITLSAGVRYDAESLPATFASDRNNFSPRLGTAWSPLKDLVVRASFGIFYDRLPLAYLNSALQKNGVNAFEQIAYDAAAAQIFTVNGGGRLSAPASGISPSIYRAASPFRTPYSVQASAGVEKLIDADTSIRAEFLFTHGVDLPRTRNINLLPPVVLTAGNAASLGVNNPTAQQIGRAVFGPGRIDPRYDAVYQLENSAGSIYRGLSFSVNRRFGKDASALASYTFSKAVDDASDFDEQPANSYDLRAERTRSVQDVRHRLVVSGVFELPFGDDEDKEEKKGEKDSIVREIFGHVEIAPIATLSSGRPANAVTGADEERSGAFPLASRPLGQGRNLLTTPAYFNTDLRVVKYFPIREGSKLDLAFEFFNLLNRPSVRAINPFYGANAVPLAGYRSAVSFDPPRQFRFSLDLEF